jgi:hypothetical protein
VPDDTHKVWSWDATTSRDFECARSDAKPALSENALSVFQLYEQRENLCTTAAWSAIDTVYGAAAAAETEARYGLLINGWSLVLGCESECLMHSSMGSDGFRPIDLGGYESAQDAWDALGEAIDSGEVGQIAL